MPTYVSYPHKYPLSKGGNSLQAKRLFIYACLLKVSVFLYYVSTHKCKTFELWWVSAGAHDNVVRYHTAWFESDYCYIQTELCDGTLTQLRDADSTISLECSLLEIMRQVNPCHVFIPQILTLNDGLNIPK